MTQDIENFKLTQEEFKSIFDENISVKKQKELMDKVSDRFTYIVKKMGEILNWNVVWFDFSNEGGERYPGYFDPIQYSENVGFVGEINSKNNFRKYEDCFPVSWLSEDFEVGLKKEFDDFLVQEKEQKKKEKQEQENWKKEVAQKKEEIFSKLTPEERCFLNMASDSEIKSRLKKLEAESRKAQRKGNKP